MIVPQASEPFIGRERELDEIAGLLADPACRLLTLVGPGGIGKTRLAEQVAAGQRRRFSDGVCFVPLAPVDTPDLVPASIASALDIPLLSRDEPLDQIINRVRGQHLLLVLDNVEHLLEGLGFLATLLQAAPRLKVLVTSRERVNLREEWLFPVAGLTYPPTPGPTGLEGYSAVQLFVQRARQVQRHFALSEHMHAVQSICRQVEGMPLGLELAASWLHAMSCEQIAARMASNLDFLTTPLRQVTERHRSLRVVFQQSWSLLSAEEQAVLRRLSLFHGGFELDAAVDVAGATPAILLRLVDKALVRLAPTGRYDIHELLRQFAREKLDEAGETTPTIGQYLTFFVTLAETGEAHAYGREQRTWFDRQEAELDNFRAALAWSISCGELESGLRIVSALRWFWEMRGRLVEGLTWFKKLLPLGLTVSGSVRAKALHRASELAGQLADEAQYTAWLHEALDLSRSVGDNWNLAWSLSSAAYFTEPDFNRATAMLEESLVLFRELEDGAGLSHGFRRLAGCAVGQGRHAYAVNLLEQSLRNDRAAGDQNAVAWDLCFMGVALWGQKRLPEDVIALFHESIALFETIQDVRGSAHPLVMLAEVERAQGQRARAFAHYQKALRVEQSLSIRDHVTLIAVTGLGSLAAERGEPERGARLLGAVQAALMSGGHRTRLASLVESFESTVAAVRVHLEDRAFEGAWAAGLASTLDQAVTEALHDAPTPNPSNSASLVEPLSPRELEVVYLLGEGLSNAEIAQRLFISVATVKVHTRNIYGKLGASNRAQAILQAQKLNLL